MADRHSGTILTAGAAFIAVGGIFMAVTGFEPTKTPGTVWANTWFDLGFAFVILGTLIVAVGVIMHFRKEVPGRPTGELTEPETSEVLTTTSAPAKAGLEVVIDDEKPTPFPGVGLLLEIEFHVTNLDPVPHMLRQCMEGSRTGPFYYGPPIDREDPEHLRFLHEYGRISERRRWEQLPPRVRAGETVRGVYVIRFAWDPTGSLPDYTLIIKDGRREYRARPHGAAEIVPEV